MMTIPGHGPMTHHMHIRREESIANGHKHNPYFLGFQVLDPFAGASPSPTTSKMHIPLIWHPLSQSHVNTVLPTYRSETCYSHISTLHACIATDCVRNKEPQIAIECQYQPTYQDPHCLQRMQHKLYQVKRNSFKTTPALSLG